MKIKNIVTVLLISFILVSCAPAAKVVVPTETAIPTSTFTPIPPTIEPSPTAELPLEQQPATIQAAKSLATSLSQAGIPTTQEQVLQQGLTVTQMEGFNPTDATGTGKINYEIAYTQDDFPLMIKIEGREWKPADFENNPCGIIFGYTDRIDPKSPAIASKPFAKLFNADARYTSNQFSPLRNLSDSEYNGEPASQPSFFVDGAVDVNGLNQFIQASNKQFKGVVFDGHGTTQMSRNNPNMYVMVISGQNQINVKFNKMDSVLIEEAFVWYLTNTTKAAINNNVNIFAFNELLRDDNYWVKAMRNKSQEQIIELAIQTVRLVAKEKPNKKFMLNDHSDSENSDLNLILKMIKDFDKRDIVKPDELVIGIQSHIFYANYDVANLNNAVEKLYEAGIRDIRLTEVDIMGKQEPTDEQILKYYISLIIAIKEQKIAHPDLNISVVFFDEAWGTDYLGKNSRITDIPNGLYQLIVELYK